MIANRLHNYNETNIESYNREVENMMINVRDFVFIHYMCKRNDTDFWKDVKNKVSKGIAEKNYLKLEKEWIAKPKELATIYNKYYDSIDDKQFVKQPAYWLSAKKYLDESPTKASEEKLDQYDMRVKMFREAVENKKGSPFIHKYAKQHSYDVKRAIKEGIFTKEEAVKYLDMENWV